MDSNFNLSMLLFQPKMGLDIDVVKMEWSFIAFWVKTRDEVHLMRGNYKNADGTLKAAEAIPYVVGVKDAPYFFMAGIWTPWVDNRSTFLRMKKLSKSLKLYPMTIAVHHTGIHMILYRQATGAPATKSLSISMDSKLITYK